MGLILFLLLQPVPANADSSSLYRYAGTVQPVQNNSVRMVEEKVHIQVYAGWSVVRCEFVFRNESLEAQNVLMGFPASMTGVGAERLVDETTRLRNFKTYDNGIEKEAKLESDGKDGKDPSDIAEWYTWNIRFQGEEERRIVNTYKTQNYNAPWSQKSGYILKTGAPWKGTIGKAVITFELMDNVPSKINQESTLPKGYRIDKNKVLWEMQDFEPVENITLELSGRIHIHDIILGQDEKQRNASQKQLEQVRALFMDGNESEGLRQANLLLEQGIYAEELYFSLLNYYNKQNDTNTFMRIIKEQAQHLNSPNILEWAKVLYPENITYPDNHKPVIQNQAIRKLDETYFELSADLYDEAKDMTYFSTSAYADALTMNSLLLNSDISILFGMKNYAYRGKGKLPDTYSDLICRMEVEDYKGDADLGVSIDADRRGESCYFYTGNTFEMWNVKKDRNFILCYYDKSFDSMEAQFRKILSPRIDSLINKLDITIPKGGYVINLYEKSHAAGLKKDTPQNITKYLKRNEYMAKLHNDRINGKSEEQDEKWDWGEVIIELDCNNTEKMAQAVLVQVMKDQFGANWQQVDSEVLSDFIKAVLEEPGKGHYYEAFSNMTKDELKKAAQGIGTTGKIDKYAGSNVNQAALIITSVLLLIGGVIFVFVRKKSAKR